MKQIVAALVLMLCCICYGDTEEFNGVRFSYQRAYDSNGKYLGGVEILPAVEYSIVDILWIPDHLGGLEVVKVADGAFAGCDRLQTVYVSKTVKYIGREAFRGCISLWNVTFESVGGINQEDKVDSLEYIGASAFQETNLSNIELPTSLKKIDACAFSGLSLNVIKIPKNIEYIGESAFEWSRLIEVDFSEANKLCYLGPRAFAGCSLFEVKLPSTVKRLRESVFAWNQSLSRVILQEGLIAIEGYAFANCSNLSSINIPNSLASVQENAFEGCSLSYGYDDLIIIDNKLLLSARDNCPRDVIIPEGIRVIADGAFLNFVAEIRSLKIPDSVEHIGYAFTGCTGLGSGPVVIDNCLIAVNESCPEEYVVPDGVRIIAGGCFSYKKLRSISIPQSVTSIGAGAFRKTLIDNVVIPESVEYIGESAFHSCANLSNVAFSSKSRLSCLDKSCFEGTALRVIRLPNCVDYIGEHALRNLKWVRVPASVKSVDWCLWDIVSDTFTGGSRLIIFEGMPPLGLFPPESPYYYDVRFEKKYRVFWAKLGFSRETYEMRMGPKVEIISSRMRETNPTIMDVEYIVISESPTARVRALAFKGEGRSFANVIRPETYIDGTGVNIGDDIEANKVHKLSWNIAADYGRELTKFTFEVLAQEGDLLPMEWITIPKSEQYGKVIFSYNRLTRNQIFDALMWLYADKDSGLTLANGNLQGGGYTLAKGNSLNSWFNDRSNYDEDGNYVGNHWVSYEYANRYVFEKMGLTMATEEVVSYVNSEARINLVPYGCRQYAYKIVEE